MGRVVDENMERIDFLHIFLLDEKSLKIMYNNGYMY